MRLKDAVRRRIGIWRAMEWRNRVLLAPALPRLRHFEDQEVLRLARLLGTPPTAAVACIVPTYRRPDRLRTAVASILAQEVQDLVVIVVDDGGGLPPLPADPRVHAVSLSRNSGVPGLVRNVGTRLSRSTFLAYLDDDNTWTPQHLTAAVAGLGAGGDLAYTDVARYDVAGNRVDSLGHDFDRKRLSDEAFVDTNSLVVRRTRRTLWSRLPRVRDTLPGEDWEFVFRLSRGRTVVHVPQETVRYLINPQSHFSDWRTTPPATNPTGSASSGQDGASQTPAADDRSA